MRIALISPKGPLYRHRGGIFKKSLRYAPLTLTTLAALVRAHADVLVTGYAEETWPQLLRDLRAGTLKDHYAQGQNHSLAGMPFPKREMLKRHNYTTMNVFEATRGCIHDCDFCVVPTAWGRKPYQKPVEDVIADIRQMKAKKALFIDLNLIADRRYAKRLFEAFIPLGIQWFGLATSLVQRDVELLDLMARSGCTGLLIGLETLDDDGLDGSRKGFNKPDRYVELIEMLHARGITLMGTFVFSASAARAASSTTTGTSTTANTSSLSPRA